MEQVSKGMMKELKNTYSLDEILDSLYDYESDEHIGGHLCLISYIRANKFSDDAYLKIIKHINGDTQFEAEKTKKYIVQIKNESAKYSYLKVLELDFDMAFYKKDATKFDTREEAKKWTNPLTEVVEVEE